jgi:hypothetical protein
VVQAKGMWADASLELDETLMVANHTSHVYVVPNAFKFKLDYLIAENFPIFWIFVIYLQLELELCLLLHLGVSQETKARCAISARTWRHSFNELPH